MDLRQGLSMRVGELRNYGVAFSDLEASWPRELKEKIARAGRAIVFGALGPLQKIRLMWTFLGEKRRAARLDLGALRARGMSNEAFLAQQLEYLAMFSALAKGVGTEEAVRIMKRVMDATAREPLLLCLPDPADLRRFDDPFAALREYFRAGPEAARKAGCNEVVIVEDSQEVFHTEIRWCVWFELARLMGVPEACLPNCYADDLAFPEYFRALGIEYRRTGTLAQGARCCDIRLERAQR